ncbi:hypothetical protein KUCAC02_004249, partial [Chaenocephalus aceratus]
ALVCPQISERVVPLVSGTPCHLRQTEPLQATSHVLTFSHQLHLMASAEHSPQIAILRDGVRTVASRVRRESHPTISKSAASAGDVQRIIYEPPCTPHSVPLQKQLMENECTYTQAQMESKRQR